MLYKAAAQIAVRYQKTSHVFLAPRLAPMFDAPSLKRMLKHMKFYKTIEENAAAASPHLFNALAFLAGGPQSILEADIHGNHGVANYAGLQETVLTQLLPQLQQLQQIVGEYEIQFNNLELGFDELKERAKNTDEHLHELMQENDERHFHTELERAQLEQDLEALEARHQSEIDAIWSIVRGLQEQQLHEDGAAAPSMVDQSSFQSDDGCGMLGGDGDDDDDDDVSVHSVPKEDESLFQNDDDCGMLGGGGGDDDDLSVHGHRNEKESLVGWNDDDDLSVHGRRNGKESLVPSSPFRHLDTQHLAKELSRGEKTIATTKMATCLVQTKKRARKTSIPWCLSPPKRTTTKMRH